MSVLLCLLLALVEVHSQTAPYLTFMNNIIPNHGYVNFTRVTDRDSELQCNTDLATCCDINVGVDTGHWYFPGGNELTYMTNVAKGETFQRVVLYYNNGIRGPSGIYRCDIETVATNNNTGHESIYVGLYTSGGEESVY